MIKLQLILVLLLMSTVSICQKEIDAVLLRFETALDKSKDSYQDTFQFYKTTYDTLFQDCHFAYNFYKKYANFHYNNSRKKEFLNVQKDTVLPLQKACLDLTDHRTIITHFNIGLAYSELIYQSNDDYYEEAETYYQIVADLQARSDTITEQFSQHYLWIGEFYDIHLKDFDRAQFFYDSAEKSYLGKKNTEDYADILLGQARVSYSQGDYKLTETLLKDAIQIGNNVPDFGSQGLGILYHKLSNTYRKQDKFYNAEESIVKAIQTNISRGKWGLKNTFLYTSNYGGLLKSWGKYDESISKYQEAYEILKELGNKADIKHVSGIYENIGDVYYEQGNYVEALEHYQKAINILLPFDADNHLDNPVIQEDKIVNLNYLRRQLGLKARSLYEYARMTQDAEYYAATLETILKFDTTSQLLLKSNWDEGTHQALINESSQYYELGIKAGLYLYRTTNNNKHLEQVHDINSRYKTQLLVRGISLREKVKEVLNDSLKKVEREISNALKETQSNYLQSTFDDNLSVQNKKFALFRDQKTKLDKFYVDHGVAKAMHSLSFPTPPSLIEIQNTLREKEGLIEYFVSKDSIYAFLLTNTSIKYEVIPFDQDLIDDFLNWLATGDDPSHVSALSTKLLSILEPEQLENLNKLIIIPDGKLLQLPFEALHWKDKYLIEQCDISYQYSTSFLTAKKEKSQYTSYLGIGCDYSLEDSMGDLIFTKLPFSIEEIEAAQRLLGGQIYLNDAASKANFGNHAEQSGIIHLALHSRLNSTYPDQSALVFQSDSTYNYLTASEIYNLDLSSDLTVLSACNTAVGEINPGDGVRSITRSFIHAGSNSVLTTLWEAPDVSTSQIINSFYTHIKAGTPKDVALRKAKLEYLDSASPSFKHPKYWAHLILVGDPSSLTFRDDLTSAFWIVSILGALVFSFLFIRSRSRT